MHRMNSAATTSVRAIAFGLVAVVVVVVPLAVALFFTTIAYLTSSDSTYLGGFSGLGTYFSVHHGGAEHWMFLMFCALAVLSWFVFAFIMFSVFSPNERKRTATRT